MSVGPALLLGSITARVLYEDKLSGCATAALPRIASARRARALGAGMGTLHHTDAHNSNGWRTRIAAVQGGEGGRGGGGGAYMYG